MDTREAVMQAAIKVVALTQKAAVYGDQHDDSRTEDALDELKTAVLAHMVEVKDLMLANEVERA